MKTETYRLSKNLLVLLLSLGFCGVVHAYTWHLDAYQSWNYCDDVVSVTYNVEAEDTLPPGYYSVQLLKDGTLSGDSFSFSVNGDHSVVIDGGSAGTSLLRFSDGTSTVETDGNLYSEGLIVGTVSGGTVSGTWTRSDDTWGFNPPTTYHPITVLLKASGKKCKDPANSPGGSGGGLDSIHMGFGLGVGVASEDQCRLSIDSEAAITDLATPFGLMIKGNVIFQKSVSSALRQVLSRDVLADIVTNNQFKYSIAFYRAADAGTTNGSGLYQPTGAPFKVATIENPDASTTHYNRLLITLVEGNATNQWQYTYATNSTQFTNTWQLQYPGNLKKEIVSTSIATDWSRKTVLRSVYNPGSPDVLVYQEKTDFKEFGFGLVPVLQVIGTNGVALTNTWDYFTNSAATGSFARLRQTVQWDGYWEQHQYDDSGRETNELSGFLNATNGSPAISCKAITIVYSNAAPNITRIESVFGHEISRTYTAFYSDSNAVKIVHCRTPGASFTNAANLISLTVNDWQNRPTTVWNENGTMEFRTYATNADNSITTTVAAGQPNGGGTGIAEGTKTISVVGPSGQTVSNIAINIAGGSDGAILQQDIYSYASDDYAYRSPTIMHLDGTTTLESTGCCGAPNYGNAVDKDGTTNYFAYDALQRAIASTLNGVTTSNLLDACDNQTAAIRIGTDGSVVTNWTAAYNSAKQLVSQADGLNHTTTFTNYFDAQGQRVGKTSYPDLSTRLETYFADGQLQSVTGTVVANPVRYEYGVEQESGVYRLYTKEVKLDVDGSDTSEWTKTYKDGVGEDYKTVYANASGTPSVTRYFNNKNQCTNEVDPDGVSWLYQFNGKGEQEYAVLDINGNTGIDFGGTDRITRAVRDVIADNGVDVYRTRTYVWATNSSATSNLISTVEESVDGLRAWSILWNGGVGVTNSSQISYNAASGYRIVTSIAPDGSSTVTTNRYGRRVSVTQRDALGNQLSAISFGFDPHGRENVQTDARVGTTTSYYDRADNVTNTVAPPPFVGQTAPSTTTFLDAMNRNWKTTLPDGTSITNDFTSFGAVSLNYGSRVYPAGFGYDAQARTKTMTNWSGFRSAGARVTTWNRDAYRGWVTNKVYDGNIAGPGYTFTSAGRLATRKWARSITTTYSRNGAGDVTGANYSDSVTSDLAFGFDRRGWQSAVTNGTDKTLFTLNEAGQVLLETNNAGTLAGIATTDGYNSALFRTNVSVRLGGSNLLSVAYTPDAASRLRLVSNGTNSVGYAYVTNSPLIAQIFFTNGGALRLTRSNSYDNWNRLTSVSYSGTGVSPVSFSYQYNLANQRTRMTLADGSYWLYLYDSLGQVTNATHYWKDATPVTGQQFSYTFDDIGNRTAAVRDSRRASSTNNTLNQLTSREVPGWLNVIGSAHSNAMVTLWGTNYLYVPTTRKGEYFRSEVPVANTSGPVWLTLTNMAILQTGGTNKDWIATTVGSTFIAQTPEVFAHDADGNRTGDGRWTNNWDGENRLVTMTPLANSPVSVKRKLDFTYDYMNRRVEKVVSTNRNNGWGIEADRKFVYDGWNLAGILDGNSTLLYSITWGKDSESADVPLLLTVNSGANVGNYFYILDANHTVFALISAKDGSVAAQYEYSPFGEIVRATGPLAKINSLLFQGQFYDWETGLYYWKMRYHDPDVGRWLRRDPYGEIDGPSIYGFVANDPVNMMDILGLWRWKGGHRQGTERTVILPDDGDTTQSAAWFTKLDPGEPQKWLRDSKEHWIKRGEKIKKCEEYSVPNTFVIGVGYGGFATKFLAAWQNRLTAALEKRGFYVAPYRFDTGTQSHEIAKAGRGKDVWGIALFGHGYKKINGWVDWSADPEFSNINGGLAWDGDMHVITPGTVSPHQHYGLEIIYFCYANLQNWASLTSPNGKYYGGIGSVSSLSGPRALGYWGSWDGLVESATK